MEHPGPVLRSRFSPDGKQVMTGSLKAARLWDADTGQPLGPPLTHPGDVTAVTFNPSGGSAATAVTTVSFCSGTQPMALPSVCRSHAEPRVSALAFDRTGRYLPDEL